MKFVDNWTDAWKWISVQSFAAIGTITTVYMALPADIAYYIRPVWVHAAIVILSVFGVFGRTIQQTPQPPKAEDNVPR